MRQYRDGTDWTIDQNPDRERGQGLLDTLALRQEEYRGLLRAVRETEDKSYSDGLIASEGMNEDSLIACATVLFELSHDPDREPIENDIIWAQEFVDHLDTLGFEIRRKGNG